MKLKLMNKYDRFYNRNENKTKLTFDGLLMEFKMNKLKNKGNDKNYLYMILNLSKYDYKVKNHIKKLISKCYTSFIYMSFIDLINYLSCEIKSENSLDILFEPKTIENSFIESGLVKKYHIKKMITRH